MKWSSLFLLLAVVAILGCAPSTKSTGPAPEEPSSLSTGELSPEEMAVEEAATPVVE